MTKSPRKGLKFPAWVGVNNPNWKGGVSSENDKQRAIFKRDLQKKILLRDNYNCTKCGKRGDLQVDHIKSWADYPKLRFEISNCRTLCKGCHYFITYGRVLLNPNLPWGHNFGRGINP